MNTSFSRRVFLGNAAASFGFAILTSLTPDLLVRAHAHAKAEAANTSFRFLTPQQARDFEAFAAQILPTDDTPGAREAGAVYFIDYVLSEISPQHQQDFRDAMAALGDETKQLTGATSFAALPSEQQIAVMKAMENKAGHQSVATPKQRRGGMQYVRAFGVLRASVLLGCFSDPSLHGNRDKIGWKLIEFNDQAYWSPPFGYYDAEVEKKA